MLEQGWTSPEFISAPVSAFMHVGITRWGREVGDIVMVKCVVVGWVVVWRVWCR